MYDRHISAHVAQLLPRTGRFTLALLRFAVCVSLSTALAFLSRQYFEEPFLRMKRLWVKAEAPGIIASTGD
jgi:peptidoglycan/LPS O-acetylase OafA/YrhL